MRTIKYLDDCFNKNHEKIKLYTGPNFISQRANIHGCVNATKRGLTRFQDETEPPLFDNVDAPVPIIGLENSDDDDDYCKGVKGLQKELSMLRANSTKQNFALHRV